MKLTKVGASLIKVNEIEDELNINKNIKSIDTHNVGEIPSNKIAICVDNDRETVKNSERLGNELAEFYLSRDTGEKIREFADEISETYMNQIKDIKHELYETKAELSKRGYISDIGAISGMYDNFDKSNNKLNKNFANLIDDITTENNQTIEVDDVDIFHKGEYIAIITNRTTEEEKANIKNATETNRKCIYYIRKITDINNNNKTISFLEMIPSMEKNRTIITKNLGEYYNNTFTFGEVKQNVISEEKNHISMFDDTNTEKIKIDKKDTGLATSFRIDHEFNGSLETFEVKGNSYKNPGDLICYVIKEKNKLRFSNMLAAIDHDNTEGITDKIIIAKSKSIKQTDETSKEGLLKFDFKDSINNKYPIISSEKGSKEKFTFIIVCNKCNENNFWELSFSSNKNNEIELDSNKSSYIFTNQEIGYDLKAYSKIENKEMNFRLTTGKLIDEKIEPFKEGLYTSTIRLPKSINANVAQLSMRIAREGNFAIESNDSAFKNNATIKVNKDINIKNGNSLSKDELKVKNGDNICVGEYIVNVTDVKDNGVGSKTLSIFKEDDNIVIIRNGDIVNKIAYEVSLLKWKENIVLKDNTTQNQENYTIEKTENEPINMNLVKSYKDDIRDRDNVSNRIIFESIMTETKETFDTFQIQIKWKSDFDIEDINKYEELIGKIFDIKMSLTKTKYY